MCAICGCSSEHESHPHDADHVHGHVHVHRHAHAHGAHAHAHVHGHHAHAHEHDHRHDEGHGALLGGGQVEHALGVSLLDHGSGTARARVLQLEQRVLQRNDLLAARNRSWFRQHGIVTLNLVSSPGAGKTTLLERTIRDADLRVAVLEGDQETSADADRIRAAGCDVVQINTGTGCHLDAQMVEAGMRQLPLQDGSLLVVENVGNLVCPALFDLGEHAKVLVCSVTEGEDKPLKYPHMFRASSVLVLNKVDLLPYVPFNVDKFVAHARSVNPSLRVFLVSALRGDGLFEWYEWLRTLRDAS